MISRLLRALALVAVCAAAVAFTPPAHSADAIEAQSVLLEPAPGGDGWLLSADFTLALPARLEEAVSRGVALYFVLEFELNRPRWYWWDERSA